MTGSLRPAAAQGATGTMLAAAGASLIAVCYGMARFAYGLFVPVLRREFDLDLATAGLIASSSYVAYCVAIVAATVLTGRWGARAVAITAGVTATVGTGLIAASPTTAVLAVGVVIAGSSTGLASPPLADAVARAVVAARRDRVQTIVNAGTGLGVMVSGPIALLVQDSWRWAWWIFAMVAVVVTVWTALVVPRRAREAGGPRRLILMPSTLLPPGAVRLLTAATLMGLASSAVWTFGRDLAVTADGISAQGSTIMWIVLGAAGMLGGAAGDFTNRVGIRYAWIGSMLVLAAATAGFVPGAGSYPTLFLGAAAFGAIYIALTGVLLLWGTYVYSGAPAFGVGFAFLMIALGQAVGSPALGLVMDLLSPQAGFLTAAGIGAAGSAVVPRARQLSRL